MINLDVIHYITIKFLISFKARGNEIDFIVCMNSI